MARPVADPSAPGVVVPAGAHARAGRAGSVACLATAHSVCSCPGTVPCASLGDLVQGQAVVVEGLCGAPLAHEAPTGCLCCRFQDCVSPVYVGEARRCVGCVGHVALYAVFPPPASVCAVAAFRAGGGVPRGHMWVVAAISTYCGTCRPLWTICSIRTGDLNGWVRAVHAYRTNC